MAHKQLNGPIERSHSVVSESRNGDDADKPFEDLTMSSEAVFTHTLITMIQTLSPNATKMVRSSLGLPSSSGSIKNAPGETDFSLLLAPEEDHKLMMPATGRPEELELAFRSHLLRLIGPVLLAQRRGGRARSDSSRAIEILVTYVNSCIEICYQLMKLGKNNPILKSEKDYSTTGEEVKLLQTNVDKREEETNVVSLRDSRTLKALDSLTSGHLLANIPFLMLEDCIDSLPMSQCCHVIWNQCIVSNDPQSKLCSNYLFPAGRLTLLRLCNKLLQKKTTTAERPRKNDDSDVDAPVDIGGGRSFMGSVLLFLAKSFALSERSGLNVLGKLNVESTTTYEDEETFDELARLHSTGTEPGGTGDDDNWADEGTGDEVREAGNRSGQRKSQKGQIIDYTLYRTFWRVQTYLSNPNLLLGKQDNSVLWTEFLSSVKRVLTAFEGHPFSSSDYEQVHKRWVSRKWQSKRSTSRGSNFHYGLSPCCGDEQQSGQKGSSIKNEEENEKAKDIAPMDVEMGNDKEGRSVALSPAKKNSPETTEESNSIRAPKYLTSSQLLKLQLRDPELRLHVLSQFQIIFAYLLTKVPDQPSFHARREEISKLSHKRVANLMKAIPPSGAEEARVLKHLLETKEPFWRAWKDHKCPPLEQYVLADDPQASTYSLDKKIDNSHSVGPAPHFRKARLRVPMLKYQRPEFFLSCGDDGYDGGHYGNPKRQWKGDLGLLKKKAEKGYYETPTVQDHFEFYVEAMDPANGIEAEYHPKNDPMFGRRGIKLFLQEGYIDALSSIDTETGDYEQVVRKVWKDHFGIDIPNPPPADTAEKMEDETSSEKEDESKSASNEKEAKTETDDEDEKGINGHDAPSVGDVSAGDAPSKGEDDEDQPSVGDAERDGSEVEDDVSSKGKASEIWNQSDRSRSRSPAGEGRMDSRRSSYSNNGGRQYVSGTGTHSRSRSNSISGGGGNGRTAMAAELIDDPLDSVPEGATATTQRSRLFSAELLDDEDNAYDSNKDSEPSGHADGSESTSNFDTQGDGGDTAKILASIMNQEEETDKPLDADETAYTSHKSSCVTVDKTESGATMTYKRHVPQVESLRSIEDGEEDDETSEKKDSHSLASSVLGKRSRESDDANDQKERQIPSSHPSQEANSSHAPERKRPKFTPPAKVAAENEQRHEPLKRTAAGLSPSPPKVNNGSDIPAKGAAAGEAKTQQRRSVQDQRQGGGSRVEMKSGQDRETVGKDGEGRGRSREPPHQRPRQFHHEQNNKSSDGNQQKNQRHRRYQQHQVQSSGGGVTPTKSPPAPPPPPSTKTTTAGASKGGTSLLNEGSIKSDVGKGRTFSGDGRRTGDDRGSGVEGGGSNRGTVSSTASAGQRRHGSGGGSGGFTYRRRNFNAGRR